MDVGVVFNAVSYCVDGTRGLPHAMAQSLGNGANPIIPQAPCDSGCCPIR